MARMVHCGFMKLVQQIYYLYYYAQHLTITIWLIPVETIWVAVYSDTLGLIIGWRAVDIKIKANGEYIPSNNIVNEFRHYLSKIYQFSSSKLTYPNHPLLLLNLLPRNFPTTNVFTGSLGTADQEFTKENLCFCDTLPPQTKLLYLFDLVFCSKFESENHFTIKQLILKKMQNNFNLNLPSLTNYLILVISVTTITTYLPITTNITSCEEKKVVRLDFLHFL